MALNWNGGCGQGGGGYREGDGIVIQNGTISALRNPMNTYTKDEVVDYITLPEVSPAGSAHAKGEYIIYNNGLYRVTNAIAAGDMLVDGTNITTTSIGRELFDTLVPQVKSISYAQGSVFTPIDGLILATRHLCQGNIIGRLVIPQDMIKYWSPLGNLDVAPGWIEYADVIRVDELHAGGGLHIDYVGSRIDNRGYIYITASEAVDIEVLIEFTFMIR